MDASQVCRRCKGLMQYVDSHMMPVKCQACKDSFGWDPVAWAREQASLEARRAPQAKKEENPG